MNEAEVKNVIHDAMKEYDKDIALPRHTENLENFKTMTSRMDDVYDVLNQAKGAFKVLAAIVACPAIIGSLLLIYRVIHEH